MTDTVEIWLRRCLKSEWVCMDRGSCVGSYVGLQIVHNLAVYQPITHVPVCVLRL